MFFRFKERLYERPAYEIAEIRNRLNLTQQSFALLLDIPVGTLRYWEQGRGKAPAVVVKLLNFILENGDDDMKVRVLKLNPNTRRIITGEMIPMMDIDWTQDLTSLKRDAQHAIDYLIELPIFSKRLKKEDRTFIYEGSNHLDLVIDGKKSTEWFVVRDVWTEE